MLNKMFGTIKLKIFASFIHRKLIPSAILFEDKPKTPIIIDVYKNHFKSENKNIIPKPTDKVNTVLTGLVFDVFII